jgi:hypothetical protein
VALWLIWGPGKVGGKGAYPVTANSKDTPGLAIA